MKKWTYKKDNKLRGAYGETDYKKKLVRINIKRHKKRKAGKIKDGISKKDATIINTLVHERLHVNHPKMHEDRIRKLTKFKLKRMSPKEKMKLYALLKR